MAAIALLVVSFFVKARGARMWAAIVFGLVVLQATLGFAIHGTPYAGLVHGANALAVLLAAVYAALRIRRVQPAEARSRRPMASRYELVRRVALGVAVTTALAFAVLAWQSTLLGEYSVMDMGGGVDEDAAHAHGRRRGSRSARSA